MVVWIAAHGFEHHLYTTGRTRDTALALTGVGIHTQWQHCIAGGGVPVVSPEQHDGVFVEAGGLCSGNHRSNVVVGI